MIEYQYSIIEYQYTLPLPSFPPCSLGVSLGLDNLPPPPPPLSPSLSLSFSGARALSQALSQPQSGREEDRRSMPYSTVNDVCVSLSLDVCLFGGDQALGIIH
jgi:hypothetical protein